MNLVKYLGLNILKIILEENNSLLPTFKEYIIVSFNSNDPSIKVRALDIIKVTTTKENLQNLVDQMLEKLPSFKEISF
jgi:hypothetical protein